MLNSKEETPIWVEGLRQRPVEERGPQEARLVHMVAEMRHLELLIKKGYLVHGVKRRSSSFNTSIFLALLISPNTLRTYASPLISILCRLSTERK